MQVMDINYWNDCPPEILHIIFQYLDTKELTTCMLVNIKWKNIAHHIAEHYKLWETIVKKDMNNMGTTFINKSTLSWRNIFTNSMLYNYISRANIKFLKTYELLHIKKINVYKENVILINNTQVMYYNINNFHLLRSIESTCKVQSFCFNIGTIDFEENDHAILHVFQENGQINLLIYHKMEADRFDMDARNSHSVRYVNLWRLENERCYVFTATHTLWTLWTVEYDHKKGWEMTFLARHYYSVYDALTNIHVYDGLVYVVSKWGSVWCVDFETFRFVKAYNIYPPENIISHNWVMFDAYSCAVPVTKTKNERVMVCCDTKTDAMMLECSELSCALQHGDVLFLGFTDGRVEIRLPKTSPLPEHYFNIQQFNHNADDCAIVAINVCEKENSHALLVSTRERVLQLELTYPEDILEMLL